MRVPQLEIWHVAKAAHEGSMFYAAGTGLDQSEFLFLEQEDEHLMIGHEQQQPSSWGESLSDREFTPRRLIPGQRIRAFQCVLPSPGP
jgi:hypothetical protein